MMNRHRNRCSRRSVPAGAADGRARQRRRRADCCAAPLAGRDGASAAPMRPQAGGHPDAAKDARCSAAPHAAGPADTRLVRAFRSSTGRRWPRRRGARLRASGAKDAERQILDGEVLPWPFATPTQLRRRGSWVSSMGSLMISAVQPAAGRNGAAALPALEVVELPQGRFERPARRMDHPAASRT